MKVARRPCFSATDLTMNLKKECLSAVFSASSIFPVHFELAVGVLVVVLIGPPAQFQHVIADFGDHVIAAHDGLLVIAGLFGAYRIHRKWSCRRRDQEKLGLDPGLDTQALLAASSTSFFSTLRGACSTGLPSITQSAATQATSFFHGNWMTEDGIGHRKEIGMGGRQVEPCGKACKTRTVLLHVGDCCGGHQLGALRAKRSV